MPDGSFNPFKLDSESLALAESKPFPMAAPSPAVQVHSESLAADRRVDLGKLLIGVLGCHHHHHHPSDSASDAVATLLNSVLETLPERTPLLASELEPQPRRHSASVLESCLKLYEDYVGFTR